MSSVAYSTSKMRLASCSFTLIFDWLGYVALLLIAIYIIQKDQVWEKFTSRKSSYARYQEPITERPTILLEIETNHTDSTGNWAASLVYGIHYYICHQGDNRIGAFWYPLQIGDNKINEKVTIELEELGEPWETVVKLTPLVALPIDNIPYATIIVTSDPTIQAEIKTVRFKLTNENNSVAVPTTSTGFSTLNDGIPLIHEIYELGTWMNANVVPQKTVSLPGDCRNTPSYDLFYKELTKRISLNCPARCRLPANYVGKHLAMLMESLPICEDYGDMKCSWNELLALVNDKYLEGLEKPCTSVEYTGIRHWEHFYPLLSDYILFEYGFNSPPETQVYEEYLILDPVGLVSSIGGTLGICIGASIHGFLTFLLHHLVSILRKKAKKKWQKRKGKSKVEPSNS